VLDLSDGGDIFVKVNIIISIDLFWTYIYNIYLVWWYVILPVYVILLHYAQLDCRWSNSPEQDLIHMLP
jgi:hypothetical protein